ncbi:MAG: hypothetical protein ACKVJL_04130 [Dehalococcoidia bacterium]|jgi:hypothetical protein|tara:strand:+ start:95 stop:433 length:339 start_codon:yes stop_codon:yes gene_type:complete
MSPTSKKNPAADEETTAEVNEGGCVHHWVIDPPNGAVSEGSCKTCGEKKEFRNSFEYSSWYGNKSPAPKAGAKGAADAKGAAGAKPATAAKTAAEAKGTASAKPVSDSKPAK